MKIFKNALIVAGIGIVCLFAVPLFFGVLNLGNGAGMTAGLLVFGYGIFHGKVNLFVKNLWKRKWGMAFLSVLAVIATAVVIFGIITANQIIRAADNPPNKPTTAVVLGCQVKPHGPGILLEERLVTAKKFLEENPSAKCILSGGQGDDEPVSEAKCMRDWLVEKGIDPQRLYMEDRSTTTRENIAFSKALIEKEGLIPEITIISNNFHQYRASQIAKDAGMEYYNVSCATNPAFFSTYFLRELGGAMIEKFLNIF